jgi:hypothetical protein
MLIFITIMFITINQFLCFSINELKNILNLANLRLVFSQQELTQANIK